MRSPYHLTNQECRALFRQRAGGQLADQLEGLHGLSPKAKANIRAYCLHSAEGAAAAAQAMLKAQLAAEAAAWSTAANAGQDATGAAAAARAEWSKEWAAKEVFNPVRTGQEEKPAAPSPEYEHAALALAATHGMRNGLHRKLMAYCAAQPDPTATVKALCQEVCKQGQDWQQTHRLLNWWEYAIKHQLDPLDPPRYHQDYLKALGPDPAAAAAFERGWDLLDEELRVDMRRTEGLGTKIVAQICVMCATSPDPAGLVGTILAAESPRSKFHQMHKATEGERAAMILSAEEITAIWEARSPSV